MGSVVAFCWRWRQETRRVGGGNVNKGEEDVMSRIYPVIMCGGAGTRMWPLSNAAHPKQYLALLSERTLLQETAARLTAGPDELDIAPPALICGAGQEALAAGQVEALGTTPLAVLVEPVGRNTAAVAATAAAYIGAIDPAGLVLLLPADHYMAEPEGFWRGVSAGLAAAEAGELVTLGIEPDHPATGYGYIQAGAPIGPSVYEIARFKEKPQRAEAEAYLAEGGFYWNAGIFLFRADAMVREFEALAPDILTACRVALSGARRDGDAVYLEAGAFEDCRKAPVDVEIMERTARAAVVAPVRAGWNDIGSWAALAELKAALAGETGAIGEGDVLTLDCENALVRSDGPFVAAIGLKDIIVIADGQSVLVVHKEAAQDVKSVIKHLRRAGREDLL